MHAGIKAFVISENVVMKKIPGASTILNLGAGILNKTTFGLAGDIADGIDDERNGDKKIKILLEEIFITRESARNKLRCLSGQPSSHDGRNRFLCHIVSLYIFHSSLIFISSKVFLPESLNLEEL